MTEMTYAYAVVLGEARSCLAALADSSTDVYESSRYDRLLIRLDWITGDIVPATFPSNASKVELLHRLEAAVDRLIDLGVDGRGLGCCSSGHPGGLSRKLGKRRHLGRKDLGA